MFNLQGRSIFHRMYVMKRVKIPRVHPLQLLPCVTIVAVCVFFIIISNKLDMQYRIKKFNWIHKKYETRNDTLSEILAAGWTYSQKSIQFKSRLPVKISDNKDQFNQTNFLVPNVVHYVWLGSDLSFTFIHYLSFLSVHRYIKPCYIFVYGESGPSGKWWNRTVKEVDNIIHVHRITKTAAPSGKPFAHMAHASDILRTEIIYKFGGIYLDADVIVLKSFDPLRQHQTVMGREHPKGICNGIIIAAKGAPFIRILLEQYESYTGRDEAWPVRSVIVPNTLASIYSSWIHVEETSLHRPNWMELELIDRVTNYNWSDNYAMHLWIRMQKVYENGRYLPHSMDELDCNNSTLGQIARHVYYTSNATMPSKCNTSHSL